MTASKNVSPWCTGLLLGNWQTRLPHIGNTWYVTQNIHEILSILGVCSWNTLHVTKSTRSCLSADSVKHYHIWYDLYKQYWHTIVTRWKLDLNSKIVRTRIEVGNKNLVLALTTTHRMDYNCSIWTTTWNTASSFMVHSNTEGNLLGLFGREIEEYSLGRPVFNSRWPDQPRAIKDHHIQARINPCRSGCLRARILVCVFGGRSHDPRPPLCVILAIYDTVLSRLGTKAISWNHVVLRRVNTASSTPPGNKWRRATA